MDKLPLVFFGTGPVAAKSLDALGEDFEIELVVTKPKQPHHRYPAPVEELAKSKGFKLCFAQTSQEIEEQLSTLNPASQIGVVIDFGVIISKKTIEYFKYGIVNSHFSLLPKHRGADPITFAILEGDDKTGVSLMRIVDKLDEGPLLAQRSLPIDTKGTQISLTEKLVSLSNEMLAEYLPKYVNGELSLLPQSSENISYSRKISKDDGVIDWTKPAEQIEREIRAYSGWPKSRATIKGIDCIILDADIDNEQLKPAEVHTGKDELLIGCGRGALVITKLQPAGKKPMSAGEFIRGYIK